MIPLVEPTAALMDAVRAARESAAQLFSEYADQVQTIELEAGHFDRHPRRKPAPAPDRRRLAAAIALAEHHVVDPRRIDAAALDQRADDDRTKLPGLERRQRAEKAPHRGAQRRADRDSARSRCGHVCGSEV